MGYPSKALLAHMASKGFVSTSEACRRALVTRETIGNWLMTSRLTGCKYAGHNWVSIESLDEATAPLRGEEKT